jgi:ADP-heptose:LPS heptosyltransferase
VSGRTNGHVLVVRLDSVGDVLVCGPAVRAVAASADRVTMLVSPRGAPAAALLPGVDDVVEWDCPWIAARPPAVDSEEFAALVLCLERLELDAALVLTSFHQSALPTALVLRLAGVGTVAAASTDYPGSLLTTRVAEPPDAPEPLRMLALAEAAGYRLPPGDDARLRVALTGGAPVATPAVPYLVAHPGADAPARAYPLDRWRAAVTELTAAGRTVVITGSTADGPLGAALSMAAHPAGHVVDMTGRTSLAELAALLAGAEVLVSGNTGPAHLAAAVGTPVVSLFAPVVPAERWAPHGVATIVLGDQGAPCRDTRAVRCPVEGHPCLASIEPALVRAAVDRLAPVRSPAGVL